MPGGGKGKGGGTIKVVGASDEPVTIDVSADVDTETRIGGGERPVRMETLATTVLGGGERPLATDMTLRTPDVLRTTSTSTTEMRSVSEMAITQPIQTVSDMRMDVQPVVVDLCLTAGIGKIPRLHVRRPYEHHIGLTVLGVKVLSLDLCGERTMIVDDLPRRTSVAWGGEEHHFPPRTPTVVQTVHPGGDDGTTHRTGRHDHDHDHDSRHGRDTVARAPVSGTGGLSIRLGE